MKIDKKHIQDFISYLQLRENVKNQADFSFKIGYKSESALSQALKKEPIGDNLIKKINKVYPEFENWSKDNLYNSSNIIVKDDIISFEEGVPYYDIDFVNGFTSIEEIRHQNPEYYINYLPANKCDAWVNATGHSMKNIINHGDTIAIKQIDKEWFPLGEVYAIVTTNNHRLIKRVTKADNDNYYRLVSENPDKEKYPNQDIPKKNILSIFKVVIALRLIN
ncbi:MAG: S24 family peptidase [Capnocytophaga felis]|nr:S24 family peptidase [Capnocytophaga felis]